MAIRPRQMLGLGNARPTMQFQQLNQAFQSDPRRILGQALMGQGASSAPVATPLQGLGRLSSALVGAYLQRKAGDAQVERETALTNQIMGMLPEDATAGQRAFAQANPAAFQQIAGQAQFMPTTERFVENLPGSSGASVIGTRTTGPFGNVSENISTVYKPPAPQKPDIVTFVNTQGQTQSLRTNDPAFNTKADTLIQAGFTERQSGGTNVTVNQDKEKSIVTETVKAAVPQLIKDAEKFESNLDLLNRLDVAKDLLADGMETGPIEQILMPFRRIGVDLNILSEEKAENLSNQEVFTAISNYLIPRMRAEGSGATSNLEGAAFARATITIDKNPRSNALILAGMRQLAQRQNKIILEKEEWFYDKNKGAGSFRGFAKWANENVPPAFQKIATDEQLTAAIEANTLSVGEVFYDEKNRRYEILSEDML